MKRDPIEFRYKVYDRKYGGEPINHGTIEATNRTEARRLIFRNARRNHDIPANARDCGYVPLRDWRIVFEGEL